MESARRAKDSRGIANAYWLLAKAHLAGKKDSLTVISLVRQAREMYRRAGDKHKEAEMLRNLADLHQSYGNYRLALAGLTQALALEETPPVGSPHYAYDLMAHVHQQLGNYGEAVYCSLQSIRQSQALADTVHIQTFYLRLGWLYYELNEWDAGVVCMKKVLWQYQRLEQTDGVIAAAEVITDGLIHQKKYGEALQYAAKTLLAIKAFEQLQSPNLISQTAAARMLARTHFYNGYYPEAEKQYTRYLQLLGQKGSFPQEWAQAYTDAGTFYVSAGNYAKARRYLGKALALRQQLGNQAFLKIRDIHYQFFRLDSLQGNYKAALAHFQQYKVYNDSIFNQAKSRQIAGLQVQFSTEKKDRDLKIKEKNIALLTQQSRAQQARLRQRQTERNALIGGSALLLAVLGLGYNRYRLKQRSNQELKARQQQINQQNDDLRQLLVEKESLLREIHHRVKNNLQVVASLLSSQAATLQDEKALSAIQESQHRVYTMALIHQKLYQSEGLARVPMREYIAEAVAYLHDSCCPPGPVRFYLSVEEIELDVAQAVPLGLILNEAITNALKYAFPGGRGGTVHVALRRQDNGTFELTIADDGVGLPAGYDPARSRSLGMKLLQGFSRQLGGRLRIGSSPGTKVRLVFGEERAGSVLSPATLTR
jgi:two-component sensor histidine kinase